MSCVKVQVAFLGSPSLIVCMVSVDIKQHWISSLLLSFICGSFIFETNENRGGPGKVVEIGEKFPGPSSPACRICSPYLFIVQAAAHWLQSDILLLFTSQEVVEKTHLSGDYFNTFLHQNYVDFLSSVEDVDRAAEYLSEADILSAQYTVSVTYSLHSIL